MKALTTSMFTGSGLPTTADSATGGMLEQRRLDLERADQVPGGVDHVVVAADEPEVAVGVDAGAVAADVPAVLELALVGRLVVPVGAEHRRPAGLEGDQADAARRRYTARRSSGRPRWR